MTFSLRPVAYRHARGAVLFVALVFLILVTLLALGASASSVLQERMTGGMRNGQVSLMSAESAARGAEAWLWNLSANNLKLNCGYNGGDVGVCYASQVTASAGPTGGALSSNPKVDAFRRTPHWIPVSGSGATSYGAIGYGAPMTGPTLGTAALSRQPQWLMEDNGVLLPTGATESGMGGSQSRAALRCRGSNCQVMHSYRVVARATGGSDASVRAIETHFGVGVPSN